MTTPVSRKVNELTLVSDLQTGDVLVGERTDGTTVRIPYTAPTGVSDGDKGDITVASTGTVWTIDTPTVATVATDDKVLIKDTSASNVMKYVTAQSIADLAPAGYTDEQAQDAVGGMVDASLSYVDGTPLLQRAALTGDVTASAGSNATTIANDAVTYAKMQNVTATDKLLGRSTAGAGDVEEIACTAAGRALLDDAAASDQRTTLGLGTLATQSGTFSGTSSGTNTGDQTITLTGDVTGSGTGTFAATIANDAVTYAKMQNISATDKLLGRSTAGAGDTEEITCTAAGRALLDDATASDQRTTLGLVIGTNVQAYDADLTTLATAFTTASASGAASLKFAEDTDNGTNTVTLIGPASTADVTLTLPAATDTLVGKATTDTLSNKTLVAPALGTPASGVLTNCTGLKFLGSGATSFHAYNNAAQTIADITFTKCQLNTERFDTGGMYDNATNYRYTPTIAGKYLFVGSVAFGAVADRVTVICAIYKNGAAISDNISTTSTAVSTSIYLQASTVVDMNGSTDYVELYVYQGTGGNKDTVATFTFLAGVLVGAD